jgi:hypothetical protein
VITLEIPELTPSLNKTLNHAHWCVRARHRKHWSMLVLVAKSDAGIFTRPALPKARVTIQRFGGRMLDHDNGVGGCKAVIDGLRDNGLIQDDSPEHLELRFEQHPGNKTPKRTVIIVEAA